MPKLVPFHFIFQSAKYNLKKLQNYETEAVVIFVSYIHGGKRVESVYH